MSDLTFGKTNETRSGWFVALMMIVLVTAVAVAALALTGNLFGASTGGNIPETPQALWESQEIEHYRYTLQVGCFCMVDVTRPVTIEVLNGEAVSVTYVEDGTAADPAFFERYNTVDKLFAVIGDAESQNPARLDVTYDETYGVPTSVSIDISEMMADEELYLTVTGFEALD